MAFALKEAPAAVARLLEQTGAFRGNALLLTNTQCVSFRMQHVRRQL